MKKAGLILTLIVFLICGLVGFKIASLTYPALMSTPQPTFDALSAAQQQNLLLIHVNDMQTDPPRLVSVWVLFLLYSDTPSLVFMPALQVDSGRPAADLMERFSLRADGSVDPGFIEALRVAFNIPIDGYVLMDDEAIRIFAAHFPGEEPTPQPFQEPLPDETHTIDSMCAYLLTAESRTGAPLPWERVLPDHFRTNVLFDPFMANWIRLTQAANPPVCKVITP